MRRSNEPDGQAHGVIGNSGNLTKVLQVNDAQLTSLAKPRFGGVGTLRGQVFRGALSFGAFGESAVRI
ncbi:hypothetical protein QO004_004122 [Rhizobium mesoamericanum]|uniref:hypothetical protein n=1 Tax=Rhizobium mesoamericanum TaxID=1079800 RepID=UPI00277D9C61|nr:hypothetical protein [Rhizobium mesoamericanum]MDQ0562317.1 hypothetical protein [Rhizobium mesoamericanum]